MGFHTIGSAQIRFYHCSKPVHDNSTSFPLSDHPLNSDGIFGLQLDVAKSEGELLELGTVVTQHDHRLEVDLVNLFEVNLGEHVTFGQQEVVQLVAVEVGQLQVKLFQPLQA